MKEDLKNYLDSPQVMQMFDALLVKYSLTESKAVVYSLVQQILEGELTTFDLSDALSDALPDTDPGVIVDLDADIYEELFFPIAVELDDLAESKKRIFGELVEEVKKNNSLSFPEPRLEERFSHIARQFLTEEYDRDRTIRSLIKGIKPGGLEMLEDVAKAVVDELESGVGKVKFGVSVILNEVSETNAVEGSRDVQGSQASTTNEISSEVVGDSSASPQNDTENVGNPSEESRNDSVAIATPTEMVPQLLVDTPNELTHKDTKKTIQTNSEATQRLVDALTPMEPTEIIKKVSAEIVRDSSASPQNDEKKEVEVKRTTPEEKQKKTARATAQTRSYTSQRVTPPVPTDAPQSAKTITPHVDHRGVHCDMVSEKELEELLAVKEQMDSDLVEEISMSHNEIKQAFLEIVKETTVTLKSDDLCERYYHLIISRLKEVRSAYETRDVIMKSVAEGGLGVGVDEAKLLLDAIEKKRGELHASWEELHREQKKEYVQKKRDALFATETSGTQETVPTDHTTSDIVGMAPVVAPQKTETIVGSHLQTTKPTMHDIHAPPDLMDPIEELRSYTIEDFHRLDSNPQEAALKIEHKIGLLSEWSFGKRYKGIDAWKGSEVMRVYREQLQQSLIGDMALSEVIVRREKAGQEFLTSGEVDALTDLNSRLRK